MSENTTESERKERAKNIANKYLKKQFPNKYAQCYGWRDLMVEAMLEFADASSD